MIEHFYLKEWILERFKNLAKNLGKWYDKTEYVIYIRNLKQAVNYGLELKKCIDSLNLFKKLS